jgi:hypothetical protein
MADQITHPNQRSRAVQKDILLSYSARLQEIDGLNSANVVISDQPIPFIMPNGELCIAVAMGPGAFPEQLWGAAHHHTATEDGSVIVGIYKRVNLDRTGRAEVALTGDKQMFDWKRTILKYLCVAEPEIGIGSQPWEPSKEGRPLCRDIPRPVRATDVLDVPNHKGWIGLQLTFSCTWDWELYT